MAHANARLTVHGRRLLVERVRVQGRPVAHVARELGVSRQCAHRWVRRFDAEGPAGLHDRSSRPHRTPGRTASHDEQRVLDHRQHHRRGPAFIAAATGVPERTVTRVLRRHGLPRLAECDPLTGHPIRATRHTTIRYEHDRPGSLLHIDVKKIGRIPDGGGWRAHGRGSDQHKASNRAKTKGAKAGYVYLHSIIDGYSRLAYTEALPNETAATTIAFFARARAFFAAHGITKIVRVVSDNGSNYRAKDFTRAVLSCASRHQRTRPYTPRHNGKIERYNRILAEELLYSRPWTSEAERTAAIDVWNIHYNYHRAHTAAGDRPPASRLRATVTNVMSQNT